MKFLSLLLLCLPLAAKAAVNCCDDIDCSSCTGPEGVPKSTCMDLGSPAFEIWHPAEGKMVCMPTVSDAAVCCHDTSCTACREDVSTQAECHESDVGYPSWYDPYKPGEPEDHCMPTGNDELVDCCRGFDPDYVPEGNDADGKPINENCPGMYCSCLDCNWRMTLSECLADPQYSYYANFYHGFTCKSLASVFDGDPHVKTWSGKWFDYHGECDLVMMHVGEYEDKGPFSVHARTKIRTDYSYISNAVLRIGTETLEVASWGDYSINGVGGGIPESRDSAAILGSIGGYKIHYSHPDEKQHSFKLYLGSDEVLEFATFKDLVSIRFHGGSAEHFGRTHGLMGDFKGRKVGRDGVTIFEDVNAFGQEWQVQPEEGMFFVTEPAVGKCKLPNITTEEKRRLRTEVNQEAAEKACAAHKGDAFQACVLDVQLTGDVAIATAGGY